MTDISAQSFVYDDQAVDLAKYILEDHEGLRLHPYRDTAGKLTIGFGRNLTDMGITEMEATTMLHNDVIRSRDELMEYGWYSKLTDSRRAGLIDMVVNLGMPRFKTFKKMIAALDVFEFEEAAREALDSLWARQVGQRAHDIANMIRGHPVPE